MSFATYPSLKDAVVYVTGGAYNYMSLSCHIFRGLLRRAITGNLRRSQSHVILEVPGCVRLRSGAPSGLASNALLRADRKGPFKGGVPPSSRTSTYCACLALE